MVCGGFSPGNSMFPLRTFSYIKLLEALTGLTGSEPRPRQQHHAKNNNTAYVPIDDTGQSRYPEFVVPTEKTYILTKIVDACGILIRLNGCVG